MTGSLTNGNVAGWWDWADPAEYAAGIPRNAARLWRPLDAAIVAAVADELEHPAAGIARRRRVESVLSTAIQRSYARPLDGVFDAYHKLRAVGESMATCHQSGIWGVHLQGAPKGRVKWDHKCRDLHLCPHEARQNQQRLMKTYVPAITAWAAVSRQRRLRYAVFTVPNVPHGSLRAGRAAAQARFSAWLNAKVAPTPSQRLAYGLSPRKRLVPEWRPIAPGAPGIHGVLTHVEDPISTRTKGTWNVHINALLLMTGDIDYAEVRRTWGFDVELKAVRAENVELQLMELVKYSAKAPSALATWPREALAEWWYAQKGARRTRSYGVLHGLKRPDMAADVPTQWMGGLSWSGAEDRYRVTVERPTAPARAALPASGVDLITAYNFFDSRGADSAQRRNIAPIRGSPSGGMRQ